MATEFTQESVLRFIISNGGKVRNADLLTHYRRFLREDEEKEQNRELFKRYVNSVAIVRQEEGVSHVVLKKKYRALVGDVPKNREPERQKERETKQTVSGKTQAALTIPTQVEILPVAGILTNNNNNNNDSTPSFEKAVRTSSPHGKEQPAFATSREEQVNNTCPLKPTPSDTDSRSSGSGQSFEQPRELKATRDLEHSGVYVAKQRQLREADGCEQSFVNPAHCPYFEVTVSPAIERKSPDVYTKHSDEWPLRSTLGQSHIYKSSPCLLDRPVSPHIHSQVYLQPGLSRSNDSLLRPNGGFNGYPIQEQDEYEPQMPDLEIRRPSSLSSSRDSVSIPSPLSTPPDTGWPGDQGRDLDDVRTFLRRSQEAKLLSQLHQPSRNIASMHHSTGHLVDDNSRASTRSSSPETHRGPIVRRLTSRLRSRMCRSLGEDLDQPFPEDNISARYNRLQLLSSTLSMGNLVSQPSSRGQSSRDLSSPSGSTRSLSTPVHDGSFNSKHSSIPLDPKEHHWFVKAASGAWTDIYALFREDPNLLNKRDFISGFTVLHWIAKHGDHRVLNTLWYGVEKAGMTFDINAKSLCGYTPLHLVAIHGHKKLIRLLVQKFKADVRIRDSSGKRPWQYLSKDENRDILELLGAPQKRINGSPAMPVNLPVRPATTTTKVKRNTSIAALFKHKSHLRVSSSPEAF
ncbi:Ankyrin repeat domain-containing protein SOWAHB [Labeo rohita]|uniref:Ankyrin repeat domain-containing protein SOWAHB n=1 Tax=Labeo rohita TaxID=84645 RepID=A0ABQ8LLQ6_LABRO|nr:ankyrin repeat domain-containing protein SOWAHB [Labeo rohita]KAI2651591.1 Ankyrin repeat domain-containing protein SOWAHB [Labeo rohita]